MTLVMVLLTIAVVAGVAAVVSGAVTASGLDEPAGSIPARGLPDGPPTGRDVHELRFVQAFRGYRMDQVDEAMDGLAAEIDRLRSLLGDAADPPEATSPLGYAPPPLPASTDVERAELDLSAPAGSSPDAGPAGAPEADPEPEPASAPSSAGSSAGRE